MTSEEAYRELGLAPGADKEAAAAAYRALCMKHHPDRGGDPHRMARITEAWSLIRDAPAGAGPARVPRETPSTTEPVSTPSAPRCRECGEPVYLFGDSFLEPTVATLCPECRAGWGIWRLVTFFGPWLVLGLVVARFAGLPLNEASYITYIVAAIPIGIRLWRPLGLLRGGPALTRLSWPARVPLTVILGILGAPVFVIDAVIVTVQAIRAGGGRESAYVRRHAEQLVVRLEDGVRGWMRAAPGR